MLQTSAYEPAVMFLIVNVRVVPGFRFGSPVSPLLSVSLTLLAPVVTGAGGSPASVTGSLSKETVLLSTIISWSMVPVFLTTNVTSPAGTVAGDATRVIVPSRPLVSPRLTWTVAPLVAVVAGSVAAAAEAVVVVAELVFELLPHPASTVRARIGAMPMIVRRPRCMGNLVSLWWHHSRVA